MVGPALEVVGGAESDLLAGAVTGGRGLLAQQLRTSPAGGWRVADGEEAARQSENSPFPGCVRGTRGLGLRESVPGSQSGPGAEEAAGAH